MASQICPFLTFSVVLASVQYMNTYSYVGFIVLPFILLVNPLFNFFEFHRRITQQLRLTVTITL